MPEEILEFEISPENAGVVVSVSGEIDMASADALEHQLAQHDDGDVIVDLGGVTFCDSSGFSVFVRAAQRASASGRSFTVRNEREIVRKAMQITGLYDTLHGNASA